MYEKPDRNIFIKIFTTTYVRAIEQAPLNRMGRRWLSKEKQISEVKLSRSREGRSIRHRYFNPDYRNLVSAPFLQGKITVNIY